MRAVGILEIFSGQVVVVEIGDGNVRYQWCILRAPRCGRAVEERWTAWDARDASFDIAVVRTRAGRCVMVHLRSLSLAIGERNANGHNDLRSRDESSCPVRAVPVIGPEVCFRRGRGAVTPGGAPPRMWRSRKRSGNARPGQPGGQVHCQGRSCFPDASIPPVRSCIGTLKTGTRRAPNPRIVQDGKFVGKRGWTAA